MSPRKWSTPALVSILIGVLVAFVANRIAFDRPNLVVIVVDTLRADAVSTELGNVETPNLASLAREGVAFPLAFSHAPLTIPAQAALFSSRHPWETGVRNNGGDVPTDLPLLAEHLSKHGYQTAAVVSLATLWPPARDHGIDRGFRLYDQGELEVAPEADATERVRRMIDKLDPEKPFFLMAHFSDPHEPYNDRGVSGRKAEIRLDDDPVDVVTTSQMSYWNAELELAPGTHRLSLSSRVPFRLRSFEVTDGDRPHPYRFTEGGLLEPFPATEVELTNDSDVDRTVHVRAWLSDDPSITEIHARYASEVQSADAAIGRLTAELMRRGLWENTLVVVTADHGEALGEHDLIGHAANLYDELLHVPLVVRLPKARRDPVLAAAAEELVRHVDVVPTILDLLDLPGMPGPSGRSLREGGAESLIAETHPPEAPQTLFCVRDRTYKMIYAPAEKSFEMYRLGPDPLELDNVYAHQGHLRETWKLVLERLAAEMEPESAGDPESPGKLSTLGY